MVDSSVKTKVKTLVDIGLVLAGPKAAAFSGLIRAAYSLWDTADELNQVPSDMLALVGEYRDKGLKTPGMLINAAHAEYADSKEDLAEALGREEPKLPEPEPEPESDNAEDGS